MKRKNIHQVHIDIGMCCLKIIDDAFQALIEKNGKPLGLELDALPLSRLREMFAETIHKHVDLDRRRDDLMQAYLDLLACELLLPEFSAKRRALQDEIKSDGLWRRIVETDIPSDLFKQAARFGMNAINPITEDYDMFGCADQVREVMALHLS